MYYVVVVVRNQRIFLHVFSEFFANFGFVTYDHYLNRYFSQFVFTAKRHAMHIVCLLYGYHI